MPPQRALFGPSGAVQSWTWGNSTAAVPNHYFREFDSQGRITRLPFGNILNGGYVRTITYDAAGRITKTEHMGSGLQGDLAASLNQSYGYDDLDRLTSFNGNGTTARYQYDVSGNRIQLAYGGQTFLNIINPASNQLQKISGSTSSKINVYDATGNLTTSGAVNYFYNTRGRLQLVQSGSITGTYQHNGLDQRTLKIVKIGSASSSSNETTHFVYDELSQLMGEYDWNGSPIEETIYLGNISIAMFNNANMGESANSGVYYIHNDQVNTPRLITYSADNQIVWRWDLTDPFGASSPDDMLQGHRKFSYNLRFPGQYYDKESNLHYNYHRDFDPQTGRYVQSDPIGIDGGINTYTYVDGNPLTAVDPFGLLKIIFLQKNDASYAAATAAKDDPETCIVFSHGSNKTVNRMNAAQLNKAITAKGCKPKQPVKLDACRTGEGNNSIGEQLADLRNSTVIAPNQPVWDTWWGSSPYPPISEDKNSDWNNVPNLGKPGKWIVFPGAKNSKGD